MAARCNENEAGSEDTRDDQAVLRAFFARGGSVQMLTGIEASDLDLLYAHACALFDAQEFAAARNHYLLLSRLDHWNFDYWFSLGLCHQRLAEHAQAVLAFGRAAQVRVDDPRPPYFTGISCRLLGHDESARKAFAAAIRWCDGHPEHEALRQSAADQLSACEHKETES